MPEFELRNSAVRSEHYTNWTTNNAPLLSLILSTIFIPNVPHGRKCSRYTVGGKWVLSRPSLKGYYLYLCTSQYPESGMVTSVSLDKIILVLTGEIKIGKTATLDQMS